MKNEEVSGALFSGYGLEGVFGMLEAKIAPM